MTRSIGKIATICQKLSQIFGDTSGKNTRSRPKHPFSKRQSEPGAETRLLRFQRHSFAIPTTLFCEFTCFSFIFFTATWFEADERYIFSHFLKLILRQNLEPWQQRTRGSRFHIILKKSKLYFNDCKRYNRSVISWGE